MLTFRCSSKVRTLFNEARRPNIIDQCRFYKANTRKQKTEASSTYCDIKLARRATNNRLTKRIYSAPLPQTLDFFLKLSRVEEGEGTVKPKTRSDEIDALRDELLTLSVLDLSAVCELYFEALRLMHSSDTPKHCLQEALPIPHPGNFFQGPVVAGVLPPGCFSSSKLPALGVNSPTSDVFLDATHDNADTPKDAATTGDCGNHSALKRASGSQRVSLCLEAFTGGSQKAALIRQIKTWLAVGLKEAKDTVESAPCVLKSNLPYSEAVKWKTTLEELGATVCLPD